MDNSLFVVTPTTCFTGPPESGDSTFQYGICFYKPPGNEKQFYRLSFCKYGPCAIRWHINSLDYQRQQIYRTFRSKRNEIFRNSVRNIFINKGMCTDLIDIVLKFWKIKPKSYTKIKNNLDNYINDKENIIILSDNIINNSKSDSDDEYPREAEPRYDSDESCDDSD